jgi:hypothetical protein
MKTSGAMRFAYCTLHKLFLFGCQMEYVAERLANLASELMQEKYIANATAAEYLLPEELLEDAYDIVRLVQTENDMVATLTSQAKQEILGLLPLLEEEASQGTVENCGSPHELLQSPTWVALRRQALACLQAMQFNLAAWECSKQTESGLAITHVR